VLNFLNNKNKAFTLIELLVVIAIIGLLSSVVLVSMTGTRERAQIAKGLDFSNSIQNVLGAYTVGIWNFDDGASTVAKDISGLGGNGTLRNFNFDATSGWRCAVGDVNYTPSQQGCSLQFDGVDDYVEVPHSAGLNIVGDMTVEAWVKQNDALIKYVVTKRSDNDYLSPYSLVIGGTYGEGLNNNLPIFTFGGGGTSYSQVKSSETIDAGWHHLVGTIAGNNMKIYVDGNERGSSVFAGTRQSNIASVRIGKYGWNGNYYYSGLIDEVRIYETALTSAQIQSQYYAGLSGLLARGLLSGEEYQKILAKN
jgi:prepilin-type N-terminal cleavage/methylation domain-containing protein